MARFSDQAMFEAGFDGDLPPERMRSMLEVFPTEMAVTRRIHELRERDSYVDLKRGELYPEVIGAGTRLRRTIAQVYGLPKDPRARRAQPNFGCNGCIETIFGAIRNAEDAERIRRAERGERHSNNDFGGCVVATPTYFRYHHGADAKGVRFLGVPFEDWDRYPVERVLACVRENEASLLILVTPNNPTGVPIKNEELAALIEGVPNSVAVIIDRTCANLQLEVSTSELLHRYEGRLLGIFHSFSKYKAMSHLRMGFAVYASDELATMTEPYVPFGLNLEATLKATRILQSDGELRPDQQVLGNIRDNQGVVHEFVANHLGFVCSAFQSNYALLRLPTGTGASEFCQRVVAHGVFVLGGHQFPIPDPGVVRLHVGGPAAWARTLSKALGR